MNFYVQLDNNRGWLCQTCGTLTLRTDIHSDWHNDLNHWHEGPRRGPTPLHPLTKPSNHDTKQP